MIINLLDNPSFELPWWHPSGEDVTNGWHRMKDPSPAGIPELQLPNGWGFVYADDTVKNPYDSADHSKFVRPEVNHKHRDQLPPHEVPEYIKHGDYCLKIFKGYGSWSGKLDTGILLEPGEYRLNVQMFADLVDHYEDGQKVPPEDEHSGQLRTVIDGERSMWVNLLAQASNSLEHIFVVESAKIVKVSVQMRCPFAINNNALFLDAWILGKKADVPVDECENPAREPYDRTVVLLPPYATTEDAAEAMRYAQESKWSVLSSADDAGVGCKLGSRTVVTLDPKGWSDSIEEFFKTYYSGLNYLPAAKDIADINLVNPSPYNLDQIKGRVLAADLITKGVSLLYPTTHQGPLVTNGFGQPGPNYDSHNGLDLRSSYRVWGDEILAAVGGKVIRAGYYAAEPWYGWQVRVETTLRDGRIMLTRYAHMEQNGVYVRVGNTLHPGTKLGKADNTGNSTGDHLHFDVKIEGGKAPAFYADPAMLIDWSFLEEPIPEPPPSGGENIYPKGCNGYLGTQQLGGVDQLGEYWQSKPPVHKTVLMKAELGHFQEASPGHAVYRHWRRDEGDFPKRPDKRAAAREWINLFISDLVYDMRRFNMTECWIESVNEVYNNDVAHNINSVEFDIAFIIELAAINAERYPDLTFRPIVMTAAVGNPALPTDPGGQQQWEMLLPLAKLCVKHHGAFGYHAYWMANLDHPEWVSLLAPYLQHRWQEYDKWLREHGVFVSWILTEGGPVGGELHGDGGITLLASIGWKQAYNGDWPRTEQEYVLFNNQIEAFCQKHGQRVLCTFYQSGSNDNNWKGFDVSGANLVSLGNRLAA